MFLLQAGGSCKYHVTSDGNSPRLVIYYLKGSIVRALIVADKTVRVDIPNPTTAKSLACLIACYFAWHTDYPPAYKQMLSILEYAIFGTTTTTVKGIEKFFRDINMKWKKMNGEAEV